MTTLKFPASIHIEDCGDGSFSSQFYNSDNELFTDLTRRGWDENRIAAFLDGDDPYENGTLSHVTIEIDTETGKFKPFRFNSEG